MAGAHYKYEGWSAPCWVITTSEGFTYPISDDDMIAVIRDVKAWSDGITERLAKIRVADDGYTLLSWGPDADGLVAE